MAAGLFVGLVRITDSRSSQQFSLNVLGTTSCTPVGTEYQLLPRVFLRQFRYLERVLEAPFLRRPLTLPLQVRISQMVCGGPLVMIVQEVGQVQQLVSQTMVRAARSMEDHVGAARYLSVGIRPLICQVISVGETEARRQLGRLRSQDFHQAGVSAIRSFLAKPRPWVMARITLELSSKRRMGLRSLLISELAWVAP